MKIAIANKSRDDVHVPGLPNEGCVPAGETVTFTTSHVYLGDYTQPRSRFMRWLLRLDERLMGPCVNEVHVACFWKDVVL